MSEVGAVARRVLLGPDVVARAAASRVNRPEQVWMLLQPRPVRQSYVHEVLDRGDDPVHAQIWMLRQAKAVRESYVRRVLEPGLDDG
jgi:hypothetical protein